MRNKGITLIALVITIVILIILAGISINLILGNNGILKKATQSKETMKEAEFTEDVDLIASEYLLESNLDNEDAYAKLKKALEDKGYVVGNVDSDNNVTVTYKDWTKTVNIYSKDINKKIGYYSNLEVAWSDINNNTIENADLQNSQDAKCYVQIGNANILYLLQDINIDKKISVTSEMKLNLNGKKLTFKDDTEYGNEMYIYVSENAKLTVDDAQNTGIIQKKSNLSTTSDCIIATDGKLYINGGNYIIQGNTFKSLCGIIVGISNIQQSVSVEGTYCEVNNANCKTENEGTGYAIGIQCTGENAYLQIANGNFEGNATNCAYGVYNQANTKIQNGKFIGKTVSIFGEGCFNDTNGIIEVFGGVYYGSNESNKYGGRGLASRGKAIIRGGNFTGESVGSSGIGISNYYYGNMEIMNGTFHGKGNGFIAGVGVENDENATMTIFGGEYTAQSDNNNAYVCRNSQNSVLTIKGGKYTLNGSGYSCYNSNSTITIEGGEFNGEKYGC